MNEDEMAAVWIARSAFESTANCVRTMQENIRSCRDLNAKSDREGGDFKFARMTGQCQGTIDSLQVSLEVLEEIVKDGLSAAKYLTGEQE